MPPRGTSRMHTATSSQRAGARHPPSVHAGAAAQWGPAWLDSGTAPRGHVSGAESIASALATDASPSQSPMNAALTGWRRAASAR